MPLKWIQDPLAPFQPQPSQSVCKNSQTAASAGQRSAAATTIQLNLTTAAVCVSDFSRKQTDIQNITFVNSKNRNKTFCLCNIKLTK